MRAALYARVSTDRQETDNQLEVLRQWAEVAGHAIVVEYVDDGISGKTDRRPAFQQMLKAARNREFDLLVFWSLDRLSREGARETLNHLQYLTAHGVEWRSHTESYLDSCGPLKDAVIAIMGCLAKQERIKISERTKAGLARTKAKGTVLGRRANDAAYTRVQEAWRATPLASVRDLAKAAGCSRTTVLRAFRWMEGLKMKDTDPYPGSTTP